MTKLRYTAGQIIQVSIENQALFELNLSNFRAILFATNAYDLPKQMNILIKMLIKHIQRFAMSYFNNEEDV